METVEKKLELELENVFGGDGFVRKDEKEFIRLDRKKKRTIVRTDIGVPVSSEKKETQTEIQQIEVNTFKRDEDKEYLLKLGGNHGKIWGVLREAGHLLYEIGEFKSKAGVDRMMKTVQITPTWIKLENTDGVEIEEIPQILNTMGNSMVTMYYDVIPKCKANITIRYPEAFNERIEKMLEYMQTINCLNKRRSTITILNEN